MTLPPAPDITDVGTIEYDLRGLNAQIDAIERGSSDKLPSLVDQEAPEKLEELKLEREALLAKRKEMGEVHGWTQEALDYTAACIAEMSRLKKEIHELEIRLLPAYRGYSEDNLPVLVREWCELQIERKDYYDLARPVHYRFDSPSTFPKFMVVSPWSKPIPGGTNWRRWEDILTLFASAFANAPSATNTFEAAPRSPLQQR